MGSEIATSVRHVHEPARRAGNESMDWNFDQRVQSKRGGGVAEPQGVALWNGSKTSCMLT